MSAILGLALIPAVSYADTTDIEHRCTVRYPSITQYFAWKDCVKTETEQEAQENLRQQRETLKRLRDEAARPCLAGDITRMEALALRAKAAITVDSTLDEAKIALTTITGQSGEIQIPDDSIRERVLVNSIETKCDADFRLLINVREGADKKLRWLRMAAKNAPTGYPSGVHEEFGNEFDEARERERWRLAREKDEREFKAQMAAQDSERQNLLRSVKISGINMDCGSAAGSCSMRSIGFLLTNVSQQPVKDIAFGWLFLSPQMTECPAAIATKQTLYMQVLQPGEKSRQSIFVVDAPENREAKFCIRITGLSVAR